MPEVPGKTLRFRSFEDQELAGLSGVKDETPHPSDCVLTDYFSHCSGLTTRRGEIAAASELDDVAQPPCLA